MYAKEALNRHPVFFEKDLRRMRYLRKKIRKQNSGDIQTRRAHRSFMDEEYTDDVQETARGSWRFESLENCEESIHYSTC